MQDGDIMTKMGKKIYNHIEIVCGTCLTIREMGVQMCTMKNLGRTVISLKWCHDCSEVSMVCTVATLKSSSPGQNDSHFADDVFMCLLVNDKFCILIKILLKFVPEGLIESDPAFV